MLAQSQNPEGVLEFLGPLFIAAFGEDRLALEKFLQEFTQEHNYWRQNFHADGRLLITEKMKQSQHYRRYIDKIRNELHALTDKLKAEAPVSGPHYVGHMASDLMLPALLAQLVTTFYNPNNCAITASNVTMEMELESGNQFAEMFGFNTDPSQFPCALGRLATGGVNANYESLWNFRAAKYYAVALIEALKIMKITIDFSSRAIKSPFQYTLWELINLSIDEVLMLQKRIRNRIKNKLGADSLRTYFQLVEENRLETLGPVQFFARHWKLNQPVVLVSSTAYAFWKKTMRLLGFGSASLIKVGVTQSMHMDQHELRRILAQLHAQNTPVLSVIGVLGSFDVGAIDPIHSITALQKEYAAKGLNFYIHIDASSAGYLMTLFKDKRGEIIAKDTLRNLGSTFPIDRVYHDFRALHKVDSITIVPHTFGYIPQGIGGFISRNREIVKLLGGCESHSLEHNDKSDFFQTNNYLLAGSGPGAKAAAIYVAHKVLPLTTDGFGQVIRQTIRACEYLFNKIQQLNDKLIDKVHLSIPFKPDSNIIAVTINPKNNQLLSAMNAFLMKVYEHLSHNPAQSAQHNKFFGSIISFKLNEFSETEQNHLYDSLKLSKKASSQSNQQNVLMLRHSTMNPWLLSQDKGDNYIDQYCRHLEKIILQLS